MVSEKFADGFRKNQARNGLKSQGVKNLPESEVSAQQAKKFRKNALRNL